MGSFANWGYEFGEDNPFAPGFTWHIMARTNATKLGFEAGTL